MATYRLLLQGEGLVTLYLQEPLCAARVFVNGVDMGGPGQVSVEDYRPLVRDTFYSFDATGETELIIQTANYSHYYGGIWYPPAAGANGACLLWGALTIGRFEPAMGLWPEEYGAFLMVQAFSWLMARRGWAWAPYLPSVCP